ncbi:MAG: PP-loop protein [archaeon GW2011_AR10]|uniref:TIGR00269 family protein n=1 Tax=Candidatus Iainarchaeum sp. TaxID=3101447 RepID=A0A7J4IY00_9ARCH|nr:MAG: PP-loop protein [archaeon GW2011_AR10]HIH07846.1 TIGR00269 family protein [Candidatus Diapherotrites archaeon]
MVSCERCSKEAKMLLPYGPHNFCEEHFLYFFENRVRRTTRKHGMVKAGEKIAVGVSGGKDSATTLYLLHKMFSRVNEIEAVMIDEGIPGYRDKALAEGKALCKELCIAFTVYSYKKELAVSMEEVKEKIDLNSGLGSTCSFCGVFRRHLLNKGAVDVGADRIATGHNLDDEVQSICMNFFDNDFSRMARLGAVVGSNGIKGLVPRIKPLYESPEKEVIAFAALKELPHYSDECCPFSSQAKRNYFREMLNKMEANLPGTKFSVLRSFEQLKPLLEKTAEHGKARYCERCGNATTTSTCTVCLKLDQLILEKKVAKKQKEKTLTCATTKY